MDVSSNVLANLGVHVCQHTCSNIVEVTIRSSTPGDDLVVSCRQNVTMFVIFEPLVAKIARRLATTYVFVVGDEIHALRSAELVGQL